MDGATIAPTRPRSLTLRAFRDADLPELFRLYELVFGEVFAARFRARYRWAFEENVLPDETRRWVLASGSEIVGFLGALPQPYVVGGRRIVAHTPCDFMVAPAYRFHGVRLMQEAFRSCPNIVASDDIHATIEVTRWLGATHVGTLVRYMKPLDSRLLEARGMVRPLPRAVHWPLSVGLRLAQRARRGVSRRLRVNDSVCLDERVARLNEALAPSTGAMVERDLRFLHWRYGPASPHRHRRLALLVGEDEELDGYAIYLPPEEGSRVGVILDLQVHPRAPEGGREALLVHTVRRLRRVGAWAVRYDELQPAPSPMDPFLRRLGFFARGEQQLFVRMQDEELQKVAARVGAWSFRYGDSESSHAIA